MQYKVSNSELRKFKRCRRAWWLSYHRRLRPVRDGVGPLSVGNMVHHVLERYYRLGEQRDPSAFDWEAPLDEYAQARLADERLPEHLHGGMQQDLELVRIMLRGYFEWLESDGADSHLQIEEAEKEVEAYLGEFPSAAGDTWQVSLIGKLDARAVIRDTGRRTFVDHKTVQNLTDLPKTGELDEQQRTYGLLERLEAQQSGLRIHPSLFAAGGTWNMLRKVKRTASAKPPFYARAGVLHNDEVYRQMFYRVWGEVRDLLAVKDALLAGESHQVVAYPNPTRDCSWDCPFFLVCARFDDGSDVEAVLAEEYEEHDPYERYEEVEKG